MEGSHEHPKRRKPRKHTQIPSTSTKNPVMATPTLPQELISAILVRLPVKDLSQFKCVCKDWLSLISTPDFVKTHLSISAKDCTQHRLLLEIENRILRHWSAKRNFRHCSVSSLFYESVTETFDFDYPIKDPTYIVGSVNGLICYITVSIGLVLWNPATRKFKQVHELLPTKTAYHQIVCGFGYDGVNDDYKVVAIFRERSKQYDGAKIYSLKRDSWRILDDFQGEMVQPSSGKLVNGKLHWVTNIVDGSRGVMSIDLVDEKCRKMEQPCDVEDSFRLTLGVLGSDLSVLCGHDRLHSNERLYIQETDMWVMKEYGVKESWTKLYTIKCPNYMLSPPLSMSIEGEILHVLSSALMIYNPEDDLMRYPEVTNVDGYLRAECYIESLVCPVIQDEPVTQH